MSNTPLNASEGDGLFIDSSTGDVVLMRDNQILQTLKKITGSVRWPGLVHYDGEMHHSKVVSGTEFEPGTGNAKPSHNEFRDGLKLWCFKNTGMMNEVHFTIGLPHDCKALTGISVHVHWAHNSLAATGNMKWFLDFSLSRIGGGFFGAPVTESVVQTAGARYQQNITSDMFISNTHLPDSVLICRLYRDPNDPQDTLDVDASLVQVGLDYIVGQPGTAGFGAAPVNFNLNGFVI